MRECPTTHFTEKGTGTLAGASPLFLPRAATGWEHLFASREARWLRVGERDDDDSALPPKTNRNGERGRQELRYFPCLARIVGFTFSTSPPKRLTERFHISHPRTRSCSVGPKKGVTGGGESPKCGVINAECGVV